jgi:hypothetical protein
LCSDRVQHLDKVLPHRGAAEASDELGATQRMVERHISMQSVLALAEPQREPQPGRH